MTKDEIEFVKLLTIYLYIYDYKIIDLNTFDEFINYLKNIINRYSLLDGNLNNLLDNKKRFINLIYYVSDFCYDEVNERIILKYNDDYILEELNKETNIHKNIVELITLKILVNHELWPHKRYIKYIKR